MEEFFADLVKDGMGSAWKMLGYGAVAVAWPLLVVLWRATCRAAKGLRREPREVLTVLLNMLDDPEAEWDAVHDSLLCNGLQVRRTAGKRGQQWLAHTAAASNAHLVLTRSERRTFEAAVNRRVAALESARKVAEAKAAAEKRAADEAAILAAARTTVVNPVALHAALRERCLGK